MPLGSPNAIAGVATLTIDGATYSVVGDLEYQVSDYNVETLAGQSGVDGTKEMPMAGKIKAKLRDTGAVSMVAMAAKRSSSVVGQLANGKIVQGTNMWRSGEPPSVNTEDATFDIEFSGNSVSDQGAVF